MGKNLTLSIIAFLIILLIFATGQNRVSIDEEIETSLPPEVLWKHIQTSFSDSEKSTVWPNDFSTIKTDELKQGGIIYATYHIKGENIIYPYRIGYFEPGRKIRYEPVRDHPFRGSISLEVNPTLTGSEIVWKGKYTYFGISKKALYFKVFFRKNFFDALKLKLKEEELFYAADLQ